MVEKFYYEILEKHLQEESKKIKSYREDLEQTTEKFKSNVDLLFDKQALFEQGPEQDPIATPSEPAPTTKEEPSYTKVQPNTAAYSISQLDPEIAIFVRGTIFSYFIQGVLKEFNTKNQDVKKIKNDFIGKKSIDLDFMGNFWQDAKETTKGNPTIEELQKLKPEDVADESISTKIIVALYKGSKDFQTAISDLPDLKNQTELIGLTASTINKKIEEYKDKSDTAIKTLFNQAQYRTGDLMKNVIIEQTQEQKFTPEQYNKFISLINDLLGWEKEKKFTKRFGKGGEFYAAHEIGGDLTATEMIDVLKDSGHFDSLRDAAQQSLSKKLPGIAANLATAMNKVFSGQMLGQPKPAVEETLIDFVNRHVFRGDVSKVKTINRKFYYEMGELNAVQDTMQANKEQLTTSDKNKESDLEPAPETKIQQAPQIDTNTLEIKKNQAIREVVATIILSTVMTYVSSFSQHFIKIMKNAEVGGTLEEVDYTEGLLSWAASGWMHAFKDIGKLVQQFSSQIPTDISELKNPEVFNKAVEVLLKQASSGSLGSILTQFNASKQAGEFSSEIFTQEKLKKETPELRDAINQAKQRAQVDTEKALNSFTQAALQKMAQNAYVVLGGAKMGKIGQKVVNTINTVNTLSQKAKGV